MATDTTTWQYRIIDGPTAREIQLKMLDYVRGSYVTFTIENVNVPGETMKVQLSVFGTSHTYESINLMSTDPAYNRLPVLDIHGRGKLVNEHGKPILTDPKPPYFTGVYDSNPGSVLGGFNVID